MKAICKYVLVGVGIFIFSIMLGCSNEIEKNNEKYLYCNRTSAGKMAETEDGFFLLKHLY